MSGEKELTKLLNNLNANIQVLSKVTALSLRNESLFKGTETIPEQIEILDRMKLPDDIIATIIGSTVNSVRAQRSQKKARVKKGDSEPTKNEGAKEIEQ